MLNTITRSSRIQFRKIFFIFCDGECEPNPGAGGWGVVVYRDGVEVYSECGGADPAPNNIME
ncbi:hypothetical protein ABFT80_27075 [Mesorhizobium sp. SB112]|uniref:hypothetical protein n=1 Tax=Mesorhizobium sp. SB112 TaxID=3151853 RepID=UPI003266136C